MRIDEKNSLNNNLEIEEALKRFNQNGQSLKVPDTSRDIKNTEVFKKAKEAFREFEMKQKAEHQQEAEISSKIEINKSLTEFQQKYKVEQEQKRAIEKSEAPKESRLVHLVMKLSGGAIKEEKHAEYVLLGLVVLIFIFSGFLVFKGNQKINPQPKLSPEELEYFRKLEEARVNKS